ncbi:MAG: Deoxyribonuclease [Dehalococcoidia bacterium]|nr:Deoxyribonuclease [Dehalococcoidia bacterium]
MQHARDIQRHLAGRVIGRNELGAPVLIAGVDISGERDGVAVAAVVVLRHPQMELVEVQVAEGRPGFPYVPGLLSFRESPLIIAACEKLSHEPDLLLVDGQGVAHPRRLGIASHLGLLFDLPSIGCAKSILCGKHGPLDEEGQAELIDAGEVVGMAVRTKGSARPVYVSIGHKVDLPAAVYWVRQCCRGDRLPEPTRLAHLAAGGRLKGDFGV